MVKGVVTFKEVTASQSHTNLYLQDSTGAICIRVSGVADVNLGDTVIGTGSRTVYNGLPQLGDATYEKSSGMTLKADEIDLDSVLADEYLCQYITIKNLTVTEINGDDITLTDVGVGTSCQWYNAVAPADLKVGDVVDFTGVLGHYKDYQLRNTLASEIVVVSSGEEGGEGGEGGGSENPPADPTTVTVRMQDMGWTNGTQYKSWKMDDNIAVSVSYTPYNGSNNSGKYYTSGTSWRLYQNENPTMTISAENGKKIVSVKVTFTLKDSGTFIYSGSVIASGTTINVDGSSVSFNVGSTSGSKGKVYVTAIEVIYQ